MILFKKSADLHKWLEIQRKARKKTGFVPTMGALHPGHISLIDYSTKANEVTVASIFVNPTQFNDPKDFDRYPITIEKDIELLENASCDVLFLPSVKEIYPAGITAKKHYDLGFLETVLEGKYRPGHFQGVCMVVERLLNIVQPDNLYLGQKDYQQCMVISRLVKLMGQKMNITICPTLREHDGLAMSSRNMRLTTKDRATAINIYRSLNEIKTKFQEDDTAKLKQEAIASLGKSGFKIDYVEIADANNLSPISHWDGKQKAVALVAAFINEVRLIDNMLLN